MDPNTAGIINTLINSAPAIIGLIKAQHAVANPDAPALTDEEVLAALHEWATQTLAKDDADEADIRNEKPDIGSDVPGGGAV